MKDVDSFVGSEFPTPKGGVIRCMAILSYNKYSQKRYVFTCSICSIDNELWPYGRISSIKAPIVRGAIPCGCASKVKWTEDQYVTRLKRSAVESGIEFIGFHGPWKGNLTKCIRRCKIHGEWKSSLVQDAVTTSGCKACATESGAARDSIQIDVAMLKISERCADSIFSFIGFEGDYCGSSSRLRINCAIHGEFSMRYGHFIGGSSCSGCANYGFDRSEDAFIYCLQSDCGGYIKVGISKDPAKRHKILSKDTPFNFVNIASYKMIGDRARNLESTTHKRFISAGFSGFGGATEWLRHDPDILKFVEQRAL